MKVNNKSKFDYLTIEINAFKNMFYISDEECYWGLGVTYRGTMSSYQNLTCVRWSQQLIVKTSDYKELQGGHHYCRNPGGEENEPWCVVEPPDTRIPKKVFCDIPHCSKSFSYLT